ncbi:MAG: hypothetical protein V8S96_02260 [Lachnospiraceae bacterium]
MSKAKTSSLIKLIIGAAVLIGLPAVIPNSYVMQLVLNIIIYVILAMGLNLLTGFTRISVSGTCGILRRRCVCFRYPEYKAWLAVLGNPDRVNGIDCV